MRTAVLLRNVPMLSDLPEELLERIAGEVSEVSVRAGEWILREGEAAESAYIVRSGRVEVLDEGPPESLLRVLRRGDVLGELALLCETTRSASARARRDAQLLELRRAAFETLIEEAPSFALGLTRALGAELAVSRSPIATALLPRTIAVVGLDRALPAGEIAERLADLLERYGSVARLSGGDLAAIDGAERAADRVLLLAGCDPSEDWTRTCVHESDLVIALTAGRPAPEWSQEEAALRGCGLLALGRRAEPSLLSRLRPREVLATGDGAARERTLELLARRLAGRSPGLVLSGGGARAMAHVGVLEQLHEAGLRFDRFAGVSFGSIIAAAAATGLEPAEIRAQLERAFADTNPTRDFAVPAFSLLRGMRVQRMLEEALGAAHIEELPFRFFCVSCDLVEREAVVHRTGPIVDAVCASLSIPGIFPPRPAEGGRRLLVDGGVLDNLPVETMARGGEGPVIASDVTAGVGRFTRRSRPLLARALAPLRKPLTGVEEEEVPHMAETLIRTLTVGSVDTLAAARLHADLVITPQVGDIGLLDWGSLPRVLELGRLAARDALAAGPDVLSALAPA